MQHPEEDLDEDGVLLPPCYMYVTLENLTAMSTVSVQNWRASGWLWVLLARMDSARRLRLYDEK